MRILLGVIALLLAAFGSEWTYRSFFRPIDQSPRHCVLSQPTSVHSECRGPTISASTRSGRPVLIPAALRFAGHPRTWPDLQAAGARPKPRRLRCAAGVEPAHMLHEPAWFGRRSDRGNGG